MKTISKLWYNWHQCGSVHDRDGAGENYEVATVGKNGIIKITGHEAQGEGDKFFYTVFFNDGRELQIFNPNSVEWVEPLEDDLPQTRK